MALAEPRPRGSGGGQKRSKCGTVDGGVVNFSAPALASSRGFGRLDLVVVGGRRQRLHLLPLGDGTGEGVAGDGCALLDGSTRLATPASDSWRGREVEGEKVVKRRFIRLTV
ncbi:hypothetical protein GUJ93_ZPchr0007g4052 [Zizania palustris]|uniref:Uncharacterized protein n=1 Tax=Zizania palustris TaxID=103762 RepID=A0A8J5TC13_ZIZPA|nr:hypothetical protein GUJ93_ZPchr0007g4052 [Zizania palustris]